MATKIILKEFSKEYITESMNESKNFKELSEKLSCYTRNSIYCQKYVMFYLNQIEIYEMSSDDLNNNYLKIHNRCNCLNCGKELTKKQIKNGNKFCSHNCAATYNNTGRELSDCVKRNISIGLKKSETNQKRLQKKAILKKERVEILKKERENNIKAKKNHKNKTIKTRVVIKKCKICGSELIDGKCANEICNKLKKCKIKKFAEMFQMDVNKIGTIEFLDEFNKVRQELYNLYWVCHKSARQIEEMYNMKYNTLLDYFKRIFDIPSKNVKYAVSENYQQNRVNVQNITHFRGKMHIHKTWDGKEFLLRSSYEEEYAKYLDSCKIKYEVESLNIRYFDSQRNKYRTAIPDFYIPSMNLIIEVKSIFTLDVINMQEKISEYEKCGYKCKLIIEHKEMTLEEMLNDNELCSYDKNKNILKIRESHKPKNGWKWINKDGVQKKAYDDELNEYLDNGWEIGTVKQNESKIGINIVVRINEHNKLEYKKIKHQERDEYLSNGWFKGKMTKNQIYQILKERELYDQSNI